MVDLTAGAVGAVASAMGLAAARGANGLMTFGHGVFAYQVAPSCTTTVPTLLYGAAVVAFPATWRQRGIGLLLGVPILFAVNIARLVVLAWIGLHANESFDIAHWFGAQFLFFFAVGVVWVAWIVLVVQREPASDGRARTGRRRVSVARFAAVLSAFVVVGTFESTQTLYGWLCNAPLRAAALLWGRQSHSVPHHDVLIYYLTCAAVVALFLATTGLEGRRLSALREALLLLLLLQSVNVMIGVWLGYLGAPSPGDPQGVLEYPFAWEALHLVCLGVLPCLHWLTVLRRKDGTNPISEGART